MIRTWTLTYASLLAVTSAVSLAHQPSAGPPSARVVPSEHGEPFSVQVPLTDGRAVEHMIHSIADSVSASVGLEYVEAGPPTRHRAVAGERIVLTGRRFSDVLDLCADAGFAWRENDAIVHLSNLRDATFLDTPVHSFAATDASFDDLLPRIHALVDPQFPLPSAVGSAGSIGCDPRTDAQCQRGLDVLHRRISFRVDSGTVRDVLDHAILAHAEASWIVRYHDASGTHARSEIAFSTFGGFTVQMDARAQQ